MGSEMCIRDSRETEQNETAKRLENERQALDDERRQIEARRQALTAERTKIEEMWMLMEKHRETSAQLVDSLAPTSQAVDEAPSNTEQDRDIDLTYSIDLTDKIEPTLSGETPNIRGNSDDER